VRWQLIHPLVRQIAGNDAIKNDALHRYLPARSKRRREFAAMSGMPHKAAKYLVFFPHHLLNDPQCGMR
jgi:hypothetical protein